MKLFSLRCQGIFLNVVPLTMGISLGFLGPSLPDINCLLHVGLGASSYMIVLFGIGAASSQLFVAKLIEKVPVYLLLCIYEVTTATFYIFFPFSGSIHVANMLIFVLGMAGGPCYTVLFHKLSLLWPGQVRLNHLILGVSSTGSVLGPLILGPFLSDGQITLGNKKDVGGLSFKNISLNQATNETRATLWNKTFTTDYYPNVGSNQFTVNCHDFFTLIYIPYLMAGIITLLVSLIMLYYFFQERKHENAVSYKSLETSRPSYKRTKSEYVYMFVMCLFFIQVQGVPTGFSFLLTTFGIESSLNLSLSKMSFMTSLFWVFFMIGRLLPSVLPGKIKQLYLIITCYCGLAVGNIMLIFSLYSEHLLWLATVLFGSFSAPVFASGMNWSGTVVQLTPRIIASYMFFVGLGFSLIAVGGTMMDNFNVNMFGYFFNGFYIFNLFTFILALILSRRIHAQRSPISSYDVIRE